MDPTLKKFGDPESAPSFFCLLTSVRTVCVLQPPNVEAIDLVLGQTNIGATTPSVYFFSDFFLKGEVLPKCDSTRRRRIAEKIVNVLFTNMKCSFIGGLFSTADHGSSRGIFKGSV